MGCESCSCYYSCQYMQRRFGTKECHEHRVPVIIVHTLELMKREETLKCTKTIWNTEQPMGYKYFTRKIYV